MENLALQDLKSGFETAFIDSRVASGEILRPSFISNNPSVGKKVIQSIEDELLNCDEYKISVAFITGGGVTPLLQTLRELDERGIKGSILTTNYLCFSEPSALERLNSLKNVTVRMYDVDSAGSGFHSKGYIFKKEGLYRIIIGSSNMTQSALSINKEWNTRIVATEHGEIVRDIIEEFDSLWNSKYTLGFDAFYQKYSDQYNIVKHQKEIALQQNPISLAQYTLEPNSMQIGFIANLREIVSGGAKKALLISATGTGKTYAAAFAMRELGFKRVLFVVHRNQIVKQAKQSFENVFGKTINTGYIAGIGDKEEGLKADYVFATVQSLTRNKNYKNFTPDYFDCCIYDESHRATANMYQELFNYFTPQLSLGMTATPDKRDDNIEGNNVYELFDHNIAYEIRLQKAMEERLLCPFHYFGIKDLSVIHDGNIESNDHLEEFRYLTCDERVKQISKQVEYFGHSGNRVKGLMFCSRIDEAKELSNKLNCYGYKTICLSGEDSEQKRSDAIDLLTKEIDTSNATRNQNGVMQYVDQEYYDYILTVDIFSEGADIVEVNQIVMLRPTQSPIIFIQQLGRGLRKSHEKEYTVVLDFIANYRNNYMIPIALSGDRSYNKDNIRRYLMNGGKAIKGESSVHFDEISRKSIYEAIDHANFSELKLIKENYANLKYKLGRIPSLSDFDEYGEMDVQCIFDNGSLRSYYRFLERYEKQYKIRLSEEEAEIVEFVSRKLSSGKRIYELQLLREMLDAFNLVQDIDLFKELYADVEVLYGRKLSDIKVHSIINVLTNEFPTGANKNTYSKCVLIEKDKNSKYRISSRFSELLRNREFYLILRELVDFGINRYCNNYSNSYRDTDFVLYKKYTYEDICRLLNWKHNEVPLNIGGYKYDSGTKTFPVFINYEKRDDISATIQYGDYLENRGELVAISKSGRRIESEDVQNFLHAQERGIQVDLFIRKNSHDDTSKEFYYLGHMKAKNNPEEFIMENTTKTAVRLHWVLDNPIEQELFEYITSNE